MVGERALQIFLHIKLVNVVENVELVGFVSNAVNAKEHVVVNHLWSAVVNRVVNSLPGHMPVKS